MTVTGDITDPSTFRKVDIEDARAIVLALNDEADAIYTTLMLNELAPDVEIIARSNKMDGWKLYQAGADYVLSLPSVTGELLA